MNTFTLAALDGAQLHVYGWKTSFAPKAIVQVVHGLAEHAGRYDEIALRFNVAGYAVYAHDQRGHGQTARTEEELGFFAEHDGWQKCIDDIESVNRFIALENPGSPIIVLGHSMGSFMVQQFMAQEGGTLAGVILSATDGPPSIVAKVGRLVARLEKLRLGARRRSLFIHALSFGAFNNSFKPVRTSFDWLSRDPREVDLYIADARCGFVATVQLWIDLLDALGNLTTPAKLARIPKNLPIHLIAGTRDPVSANTVGVEKLMAAYARAGLDHVTHRFYPQARHELFHETNREEVARDLILWLDEVVHRLNLS